MYRRAFVAVLCLVTVVVLALPAFAQPAVSASAVRGEPVVPEKAGKEIQALYVGDTPPRLDGRLDDEIWQNAQAIEDMVQNDPDNMQAPTERTVVKIAYDNRSVYVGVINYMKDPSKITTALGRRDTFPRSDSIKITFDPRHDHLTAYTFDANPLGVQGDMTWFDDSRSSTDYDAVWDVRTQIDKDGWTAEFRIPFSQLRFTITPGEAVVWGFNVRRDIVYNAEMIRWVGTPRGAQGFVSRFGHVTFAQPPSPPRRLEVQPFALAQREHTSKGSDPGLSGGLDFRMGLGTATTLSAALNPDFGQVEQDPAVLNLSVFESFFPEKRPFFIEDSRVLVPNYPQVPMFYSRRIGQRPNRFAVPAGETVLERPVATTILGATKVTGKARGWTYGGLTALTDREYALVHTAGGGETERLVEPYTSYNVGRVQKDLFSGSSTIGGLATTVQRQDDLDAYTGSVDYSLRWAKNTYTWNGQWSGTRSGVSGVMKNGFGGVTNFNYNSKHLNVFSHYDFFSSSFKNSDLGFFFGRNNKQQFSGGLNVGNPDPWRFLRNISLNSSVFTQVNLDGLKLDESYFIGTDGQFLNYWNFFIGTGRARQAYDDLDTRGGPPIVKPAAWFLNSFVGTDSRKRIRLGADGQYRADAEGGHSRSMNVSLNFQPRPQVQASISAGITDAHDIAQWIKNEDVTGDGVEDHVYGTLERNVVNMTARGTYAFTRDMTLEVYLQPFVAVGDYGNIRRLAKPRSFEFEPVTINDNPDFNNKSLRSNVVFRWEYRRGSTMYLVYNVSNSDTSRPGDFSAFRDLRSGFGASGTQVLMVKLSYWLGL